jgi:hypothetical protein
MILSPLKTKLLSVILKGVSGDRKIATLISVFRAFSQGSGRFLLSAGQGLQLFR